MTTRGLQLLLLHHLEKGVTNTENHTNQIGSGIGLFIQADCLCLPPPFYQVGYPPPSPPTFPTLSRQWAFGHLQVWEKSFENTIDAAAGVSICTVGRPSAAPLTRPHTASLFRPSSSISSSSSVPTSAYYYSSAADSLWREVGTLRLSYVTAVNKTIWVYSWLWLFSFSFSIPFIFFLSIFFCFVLFSFFVAGVFRGGKCAENGNHHHFGAA